MLFSPINTLLFAFERTGLSVDCNVQEAMPVKLALAAEGGIIKLQSFYMETHKKEVNFLNYYTPCRKIKLLLEMTHSEYIHNLDFFGGAEAIFDEPIIFDLVGNKFKMP